MLSLFRDIICSLVEVSTRGFRVHKERQPTSLVCLVELPKGADLWGMERIWGGGERRGCRALQACVKHPLFQEPQVFAEDKVGVVECLYCLLKIG